MPDHRLTASKTFENEDKHMKFYQFLGLAGLGTFLIIGSASYQAMAQGYNKGEGEGYHHRMKDRDDDHHGRWMKKSGLMGGPMNFEMLDADGDGQISREEFENREASMFNAADSNDDDQVSAEELKAFMIKRHEARLDKMVERMMERVDSNDDGVISQDEFQEMKEHHRERRGKGYRGDER
jgi:hypothetical protein